MTLPTVPGRSGSGAEEAHAEDLLILSEWGRAGREMVARHAAELGWLVDGVDDLIASGDFIRAAMALKIAANHAVIRYTLASSSATGLKRRSAVLDALHSRNRAAPRAVERARPAARRSWTSPAGSRALEAVRA